jgi:hypothetical protein
METTIENLIDGYVFDDTNDDDDDHFDATSSSADDSDEQLVRACVMYTRTVMQSQHSDAGVDRTPSVHLAYASDADVGSNMDPLHMTLVQRKARLIEQQRR